jgi:p-aminobenzoyl-glutamate transporter AbgT
MQLVLHGRSPRSSSLERHASLPKKSSHHASERTKEPRRRSSRASRRWRSADSGGGCAAAGLLFTVFLLAGTVPADGFLRDPETGDLLHSPFMSGIVAFIFLGGA